MSIAEPSPITSPEGMANTATSQPSAVTEQALALQKILQQAIEYHQSGNIEDAETLYRNILEVDPNHPETNHNLGVLAVQVEQVQAALPYLTAALQADPAQQRYWLSYIQALVLAGEMEGASQALELGRQHGVLQGESVDALVHRMAEPAQASGKLVMEPGVVKVTSSANHQSEKTQTAPKALRPGKSAASKAPRSGGGEESVKERQAVLNCWKQRRFGEAETMARSLTARFPRRGFGWKMLAMALLAQQRIMDALAPAQRAAELSPDDPAVHIDLGVIFRAHGRFMEAEASLRRAVQLDPDLADAHRNLGAVLTEQMRFAEAEASQRRALALEPDRVRAHQALLFLLNYDADKSAEEIFAAYGNYNERIGLPHRSAWRDHTNSRDAMRRLKVGYVSPDFRNHSVRFFLEPLLAHHDKQAVEVYLYAELRQEDAQTQRYRTYADHWIPTAGLSDDALAERIRADGIDILVDLAGHTEGNRLQVFARKPVPVSLSWLGYGYTTGLMAIDYLLTDSVSSPEGSESLFSEAPWRLATPGFVYRPAEGMGPVSPLPAARHGKVTFGTLTRAIRINHRTIRVWSEILKRVDNAQLLIDSLNFQAPETQALLTERFAAHGIGPERLVVGFHSPPWDLLREMDIGLDCFPHNSGTTLFETLYMGVPYITLAGRPSVGRLGSSVLEGVGHSEWIARSEEDYIEKAVALASDLPALAAIRSGLRSEMEAGPLMDEPGFARKVEAAYREMWIKWSEKKT